MRRVIILLWLGLNLTGLWLTAGATDASMVPMRISARLIAASDAPVAEAGSELADLLPLLKDNLKFNSFRLICRRNFVAMEDLRVKLDEGMSLVISQIKKETGTFQVERRGKILLNTRLRLEAGRPVVLVLAGFTNESGATLILVLGSE